MLGLKVVIAHTAAHIAVDEFLFSVVYACFRTLIEDELVDILGVHNPDGRLSCIII